MKLYCKITSVKQIALHFCFVWGSNIMEKNVKIALLFDFYGDILTAKQLDCIDLYYNEDLSLSEISRHLNITRQGVLDNIKRGESALLKMEDKLALVEKFDGIQEKLADIEEIIRKIEQSPSIALLSDDIKRHINDIILISRKIAQS